MLQERAIARSTSIFPSCPLCQFLNQRLPIFNEPGLLMRVSPSITPVSNAASAVAHAVLREGRPVAIDDLPAPPQSLPRPAGC